MNKLLLVDSDQHVSQILIKLLEIYGFTVDSTTCALEALRKLDVIKYDLVITDHSIFSATGMELLNDIRKFSEIPVILTTVHKDLLDCVTALDNGADDYLLKPFNDRELVARINAILRRVSLIDLSKQNQKSLGTAQTNTANQYYKNQEDGLGFLGLKIDLTKQVCYYEGSDIFLTSTELRLLEILIKNVGDILSKEYLITEVLGKSKNINNRSIDVHVSNLRRKLPDRRDGLEWIKTIRKKGYILISG